jgi:class 3 adenylate cyclase
MHNPRMDDAFALSAPVATSAELLAARRAIDTRDWMVAYDGYAVLAKEAPLPADDLERYALSAFFTAHPDQELEISEQACKASHAEGDDIRAAYTAIHVARSYFFEGKGSMASAWLRRAEQLLGDSADTYAHGFLEVARSEQAAITGDVDAALVHAERAIALADRNENADLKANARSNLGTLKIATGMTTDGIALMEEASIAAVQGELSPFATGVTCCQMISACRDLTDYNRAIEWIDATERYCQRQDLSGFPGVCRVHRAEVKAVKGDWQQAEIELERATTELERYRATVPQADGFYAIGDIRRLKGDYDGAEEALDEAHARGRSPQPARALIRLARGNTKAALSAINAAIEDEWSRPARSRLLPAQVQIAIAAGDLDLAASALDQFTELVAQYPAPALDATRDVARGRLQLAQGDAADAARTLRTAIRAWTDVEAPYEVAKARVLRGRALRALEDEDEAATEFRAAAKAFATLGATIDAAEVRKLLAEGEDIEQVTRTFLFTDIVDSTKVAELLGDTKWANVLRIHDETLHAALAASRGTIVNTTGDGVFAVFDSAVAGVAGAVAIQRAFADKRLTGLPVSVRIGLHTAEATRREDDYSGVGVHVAARVAALAKADEIVVSAAVLDALPEGQPVVVEESEEATLKGINEPVRVSRIGWD